jgi:hypothetical protein
MEGADFGAAVRSAGKLQRGQIACDQKLDQEQRNQQMEDGFFHGVRSESNDISKTNLIRYCTYNTLFLSTVSSFFRSTGAVSPVGRDELLIFQKNSEYVAEK